jgi:hydrogenase expression/formation protein HypC
MCLGIPGRIIDLHDENPHLAMADVFGVQRQINVGLIDDGVVPGDWVLLHVGFAINKLGPEELAQVQASLSLVGNREGDSGDQQDPLADLEAELAERSMRRTEQGGVEQWA